jgi:hypothetical protein
MPGKKKGGAPAAGKDGQSIQMYNQKNVVRQSRCCTIAGTQTSLFHF